LTISESGFSPNFSKWIENGIPQINEYHPVYTKGKAHTSFGQGQAELCVYAI